MKHDLHNYDSILNHNFVSEGIQPQGLSNKQSSFVTRLFAFDCNPLWGCSNIFSKEAIISNNTKFQKQILKFIHVYETFQVLWWYVTDEILPMFTQLLWTLKFISPTSQGKLLFLVLFHAAIYVHFKL